MKLKFCYILLVVFSIQNCSSQNWASLNGGANNEFASIFGDTTNNVLYCSGAFDTINGKYFGHIAKWNGTGWDSLAHGVFGATAGSHAFDIYNGDLIFKGTIFHPWHIQIARWNGTTWDSIGSNFKDGFLGIKVLNNELYAYGIFDIINGIYYNSIAKWNGTDWVSVGFPYKLNTGDPIISCLAMYNNELYAGGIFTDSSGITVCNIAKYNGTYWSIVGGGIHGSMDNVNDLEVFQNELYIAGQFKINSGNISNGILKWDGNTLKEVGGGITSNYNATIYDLMVLNNKLYAVGTFDSIGGISANYFASWDGINWCGYGNSWNTSTSSCLATINHDLYLTAGPVWDTVTVNNIAKWIGGNYIDTCGHLNVGINEFASNHSELNIYPNPSTYQINIEFDLTENKNTSIEIKNILGQTVKKIDSGFSVGNNKIEINVSELSGGVYFIQVQNNNNIIGKKFIRQ